MWIVGSVERISRAWRLDGVLVSTGTANVRIMTLDSGVLKYLQSDFTTLSTTPHDHAMTFAAGIGWVFDFTVPASLTGRNVTATATHSDTDNPSRPENHFVATYAPDTARSDILADIAAHDASEAVRFGTVETNRAAMEASLIAEHDATQSQLATHDSTEAGRFATAESARAAMQSALVAEHDATQAELASGTYGLGAIKTAVDTVDAVVDAIRATDVPAIQANIDAEHATTRALVQNETDALDAAVADLDADLATHDSAEATRFATAKSEQDARQAINIAEHDATQSQIATHDDVLAALQDDFDAFELINQAEHDDTQTRIDKIGNRAEATLIVPTNLLVPESGSKTYRVRFSLRDFSANPSVPTDPDSNIVDLTAVDQSGAAVTGLTLAGTPAGRFTRDAAGDYYVDVTVDSTAVPETQVQWRAAFQRSGSDDFTRSTSILVDTDPQLARVEANTNTLLTRVGTSADGSGATTVFGKHKLTKETVEAQHATTRTLVQDETDAIDAQLAHASHGLNALKTLIDTVDTVVDAIRATDVPGINANMDAAESSLLADLLTMRQKAAGIYDRETDSLEALRDRLDAIDTDADTEHAATRALIQAETDALDAAVADLDADLVAHDSVEAGRFATAENARASMESTLVAEHDATQAAVAVVDNVVDAIRDTDVPAIQANVDAEHVTTRALIQAETDALDAAVANVDADLAAHDAAELVRFGNAESSRVSMEDRLTIEHEDTQAAIAAHDGDEVVRFATVESNRSAMEGALVAEHVATRLAVADAQTAILAAVQAVRDAVAELDVDVGESNDAANASGSAHAKLSAALAELTNATHGLSALNGDLDVLLGRVGLGDSLTRLRF